MKTKAVRNYSQRVFQTRKEFTKDSNVDVCKSCSYFVPRAPCGVLKLVEYDRDTKMMTVIYEGEHNC